MDCDLRTSLPGWRPERGHWREAEMLGGKVRVNYYAFIGLKSQREKEDSSRVLWGDCAADANVN